MKLISGPSNLPALLDYNRSADISYSAGKFIAPDLEIGGHIRVVGTGDLHVKLMGDDDFHTIAISGDELGIQYDFRMAEIDEALTTATLGRFFWNGHKE